MCCQSERYRFELLPNGLIYVYEVGPNWGGTFTVEHRAGEWYITEQDWPVESPYLLHLALLRWLDRNVMVPTS